jgi:albonoursin synthase
MTAASGEVLDVMRRRRVTRAFLDDPVAVDDLKTILRAARWASSAGNRRIHRFLVIRDRASIERLRPFAPGILRVPPAVIVISTDLDAARVENVQVDRDKNTWIDVGTALTSMMLAAEALGLGSCPATSFSPAAVAQVLSFPDTLLPELMLQVGRPAPKPVAAGGKKGNAAPTIADLTDWETLGQRDPPEEGAAPGGDAS